MFYELINKISFQINSLKEEIHLIQLDQQRFVRTLSSRKKPPKLPPRPTTLFRFNNASSETEFTRNNFKPIQFNSFPRNKIYYNLIKNQTNSSLKSNVKKSLSNGYDLVPPPISVKESRKKCEEEHFYENPKELKGPPTQINYNNNGDDFIRESVNPVSSSSQIEDGSRIKEQEIYFV